MRVNASSTLTFLPYITEQYSNDQGTVDKVFPDQQQALQWLEQNKSLIEDAWIDGAKLLESGNYVNEADVPKDADHKPSITGAAQQHTLTIEVTGTTEQGYTARITALTGAQDINALTDYGVQLEVQARSAGEALVLMGQNFQRAGFLE